MIKKQNLLVLLFSIFVLLISLSGITGIIGQVCYYGAFVLPIGLGLLITKTKKEDTYVYIEPPKEIPWGLILPLFPITLLLTFGISALTGLLFQAFGEETAANIGESLTNALILHALVPAVLEEALFRYLPATLLRGENHGRIIAISSLLFAFGHTSLYQLPYALFAGTVYMAITLATGSVIPTLLLHFLNNALSVIGILYGQSAVFPFIFYGSLIVFSIIGVIKIFKNKDVYKSIFSFNKEPICNWLFTFPMVLYLIATITLAILLQ